MSNDEPEHTDCYAFGIVREMPKVAEAHYHDVVRGLGCGDGLKYNKRQTGR